MTPNHSNGHQWEVLWDNGTGQQCVVCSICGEMIVFEHDDDESDDWIETYDYTEGDIGQDGEI